MQRPPLDCGKEGQLWRKGKLITTSVCLGHFHELLQPRERYDYSSTRYLEKKKEGKVMQQEDATSNHTVLKGRDVRAAEVPMRATDAQLAQPSARHSMRL